MASKFNFVDLDKSKQFYEMLLGSDHNSEIIYQPLFDNEENIFFWKTRLWVKII